MYDSANVYSTDSQCIWKTVSHYTSSMGIDRFSWNCTKHLFKAKSSNGKIDTRTKLKATTNICFSTKWTISNPRDCNRVETSFLCLRNSYANTYTNKHREATAFKIRFSISDSSKPYTKEKQPENKNTNWRLLLIRVETLLAVGQLALVLWFDGRCYFWLGIRFWGVTNIYICLMNKAMCAKPGVINEYVKCSVRTHFSRKCSIQSHNDCYEIEWKVWKKCAEIIYRMQNYHTKWLMYIYFTVIQQSWLMTQPMNGKIICDRLYFFESLIHSYEHMCAWIEIRDRNRCE